LYTHGGSHDRNEVHMEVPRARLVLDSDRNLDDRTSPVVPLHPLVESRFSRDGSPAIRTVGVWRCVRMHQVS
jgi:hypothetical protein